jgi:hypothetical protein
MTDLFGVEVKRVPRRSRKIKKNLQSVGGFVVQAAGSRQASD